MEINKELLQTLMDAMPAPIFYKDAALIYRGCNIAFERFIGLDRDEIIGQSVYGVSPKDLADVYHKADSDLLAAGGEQIYEAKVRYADGSLHTVEFRKAVFYDPRTGRPDGMIGIMLDITQRRVAENAMLEARVQAEEANRAKSFFLANISHELRTPLNAIIGFSQIIEQEMFGGIGNQRYISYARDIGRSSGHLLGIINNLLDLSRIEAGQVELSLGEVNLSDLADQCIGEIVASETAHGLNISTALSSDLQNVRTDEKILRQILLNLLSNAAKYSGPDCTISVSGERADDTVLIRVVDDGIGMAPELLATVFEPFQRARTHIDTTDGFGLGLPIAKALSEQLGGSLDLRSEVNRGTEAIVRLPLD